MKNLTLLSEKCWIYLCFGLLQNCTVLSPSIITCLSPESIQTQETSVQFILNGVPYTGDSPSSSDERPDEEVREPHKEHFHLGYVEDPQFFTANKEKQIKHHSGEPLTLIINVSNDEETEWLKLWVPAVFRSGLINVTQFYQNLISFLVSAIFYGSALIWCILNSFLIRFMAVNLWVFEQI